MKNKNILFLLLLPILFYIGVKFLNNANHTICIFKLITKIDCPGCGMSRAFNEIFNFHFKEAYKLNPRVFIVFPLLFYIWISTLIREIKLMRK